MTTAVDNSDEQNKSLVLKNVFGSHGTIPLQKCSRFALVYSTIYFPFHAFQYKFINQMYIYVQERQNHPHKQ